MNYDVVVLGAGAAGMMAAIEAGRRGRRVLVVDHAQHPGEKIRISGGGRCNFTNVEATSKRAAERFISGNPRFAVSALARYTCTVPGRLWTLHAITAGCLALCVLSMAFAARLARAGPGSRFPGASDDAPDATWPTPDESDEAPDDSDDAPDASCLTPDDSDDAPDDAEDAPDASSPSPEASDDAPDETDEAPDDRPDAPDASCEAPSDACDRLSRSVSKPTNTFCR